VECGNLLQSPGIAHIFGCMGGSGSEFQGDIIAEILELAHILAEGHQLGVEGYAHQLATLLLKLHHRLIVAKSKLSMGFKKILRDNKGLMFKNSTLKL